MSSDSMLDTLKVDRSDARIWVTVRSFRFGWGGVSHAVWQRRSSLALIDARFPGLANAGAYEHGLWRALYTGFSTRAFFQPAAG